MPESPRKSPRRARQAENENRIPPVHDWRTTDQDEINRRRIRAHAEQPRIRNLDPAHRIFSDFEVQSGSGLRYRIEIRDLRERQFSCGCVDFRVNGLGTCKHVEAVLAHLETRFPRAFKRAQKNGSERIDLVADPLSNTLRIERGRAKLPAKLRAFFEPDGQLKNGAPEEAIIHLRAAGVIGLRLSQEIEPWLERRRRAEERVLDQRAYEEKVRRGEYPPHETLMPLYPYQREGMLHLAFTERALLADEMGLGKTIQAIAACALLQRLGKAQRALVITPASLKTEWEEQIQKFTRLPYQIVFGQRHKRLEAYSRAPFFTLVNYEQMVGDALEVNARLGPDIVVLDEAQRIKNWSTKTAQAVKRLQSRYAFVLTGTPIENRIDEIFSIVNFLDPIRTTRYLHPETASVAAPLSKEEQQQAAAARDRASRKLRFARILVAEDLAEEARPALIEALHQLNSAEAIEQRLSSPTKASDALVEPWNLRWLRSTAILREFLANDAANPAQIIPLLQSRCIGNRTG